MKIKKKYADPRKKLKKELDGLWATLVKLIAKNRCEYCGRIKHLNSHHIFSRSRKSVRWDERNGVCLCALHHCLGVNSAHKAPLDFAEWIKSQRGESWYQALRLRANTPSKPDMDLTKIYLEQEIKRYQIE